VVSPKNQRYSDDKNKKSFKFIFEPKSPTNSFKENSIFSSKNFD
jgi:hypothetical protein